MICEGCGSVLTDGNACSRCGAQPPSRSGNATLEAKVKADNAEYRPLTVLFCDLVGSTALSEVMDPEDLRIVLREYQRRCAEVVRNSRGHVAQFLGDGVMAYFGYPSADDRTAVAAVEAGLSLLQSIRQMSADFSPRAKLQVRVGVHSGSVVVGDMGDPSLPQTLAVGATPNLAARVQAEADSDSVFISDATYRLVEGYFDCELAGTPTLRGVSRPVQLYRVLKRRLVSNRLQLAERRSLSPFMGRGRELTILLEAWQRRDAGERGFLLIGEPGIGKSRLLYEFTRLAGDHQVIDCSAVEHHESDALFPVLGCLARFADARPGAQAPATFADRLADIDLSHCSSELEALLPTASGSVNAISLATAKHYQRTVEILGDFVDKLAGLRPSVLLVEDAQWLDPSTRYFLQTWAERYPGKAFVLATARVGADVEWAKVSGLKVLTLDRLEADASRAIAHRIGEQLEKVLPDDAMDQLLSRAEGVPLFIEESVRAYAEIAAVPPRAPHGTSSDLPGIPETLRDSLTARLDRLGTARRLAQLAAVIGRTFPLRWLERLLAFESTGAIATLTPLLEAGLVREHRELDGTYEFSHALIRDAAYESLMRGARAKYHQRIADIIVEESPEVAAREPLVVAHHYEGAGNFEAAAKSLLVAVGRSLAKAAFIEAIDVSRRALDLLGRSDGSTKRETLEVELLGALGLALISTRGYSSAEVEDVYSRAGQICERHGDVPLRVLYGVWATHVVRADAQRVDALVQVLERRLESSPDEDERLVIQACLGVRAFYEAELARAERNFDQAAKALDWKNLSAQHERLRGVHGFEGMLSGVFWGAWVNLLLGNIAAAKKGVREGWEHAERLGDPYTFCQVALYNASICRDIEDAEACRFFTERVLQISGEHELVFWRALGLCVQSWLLSESGSHDEALASAQGGLTILDALGSVVNRAYFQTYLVDVHLKRGDFPAALAAADIGLAICDKGLGPMYVSELFRLKGIAFERSGKVTEAEGQYVLARELSRRTRVPLLEQRAARDLGTMLRAQGRIAEAEELLGAPPTLQR